MTVFAATDEHSRARYADDASRSHLAQQPWGYVVRVDVRNRPFGARPSHATRRRFAAGATARDIVSAVCCRYIDGQVEDESMLTDLEMRIVEQFRRRRAED